MKLSLKQLTKIGRKLLVGLGGAIVFSLAGVYAPLAFHTVTPASYYYELHAFIGEDITVGDTTQDVHIQRTVRYPMSGVYIDELNLIHVDGNVTTVHTRSDTTLYEVNEEIIGFKFDIPSDLEEGQYYWNSLVVLDVYNNVRKTVRLESNVFEVKEN